MQRGLGTHKAQVHASIRAKTNSTRKFCLQSPLLDKGNTDQRSFASQSADRRSYVKTLTVCLLLRHGPSHPETYLLFHVAPWSKGLRHQRSKPSCNLHRAPTWWSYGIPCATLRRVTANSAWAGLLGTYFHGGGLLLVIVSLGVTDRTRMEMTNFVSF